MGQISKAHLQNKAHEMVACLELIKLNIKTDGNCGSIANGKRKLPKWVCKIMNFMPIPVNYVFWLFILYILYVILF